MALAATAVHEVRTTGSDLNGGGFNPARGGGGVDWSRQDAARVVIDGGAAAAVAGPTSGQNMTLTGYAVSTADLGNHVNIAGVPYEITAINAGANYWTLDKTTGATVDAALTGRMGGANASLGFVAANAVSGNRVYVASGTYTLTSGSTNVSGGLADFSTQNNLHIIGYHGTRDVDPGNNRPVIVCPSSIATPTNGVLRMRINSQRVAWLVIQVDNTTSTLRAFQCESQNITLYRCKATMGTTSQSGFYSNSTWANVEECETNGYIGRMKATKCVARNFGNGNSSETLFGCIATDPSSAATGINLDPGCLGIGCVAAMSRIFVTRSGLARLCYANSFVTASSSNNGGERFAENISPNAFPTMNGYTTSVALRTPEQLQDNSVDATAIFTNPASGDYRLTAYGLTLPRARFIASCISGCPGVQTDSLATLFASRGGFSASRVFNGM